MVTGSSRASASLIVANTAPTIRSAAILVVEVSTSTCETNLGFRHVVFSPELRLGFVGWYKSKLCVSHL